MFTEFIPPKYFPVPTFMATTPCGLKASLFKKTTLPPTGTTTVVPGLIVPSLLKVIVTDGWGVGDAVGVAFGVAVVFTTTTVVGTSVGTVVTTVVGTVVGTGVGVGVTVGVGWVVQPARRI